MFPSYTNRCNFIGNISFDVIRICVLLYSVYLIIVLPAWKKEKQVI